MKLSPALQPYRVIRHGSSTYPVYVGVGLLASAGWIVTDLRPRSRKFVVTTDKGREVFESRLRESFEVNVDWITMEDGEASKTFETAGKIVSALIEADAKRDSVVVAVGGGVAGDTAGFAAAIVLRGIDLVQVPTTLLAQVDSSIGGKVGVNHAGGKNLVGAFHPPIAVIADTGALGTLPRNELLSGVFESLKGGVIGDPELFDLLEGSHNDVLRCESSVMETLVRRSIDLKASIVEEDEREGDRRRILNYGHTIGHGIEAALHYEGLTHGEAVAWGMIAANAIGRRRGVLSRETSSRIDSAIQRYEPRPIPPLDREEVLHAVSRDKKFAEGKQVMILAREIGLCEIVSDITTDELRLGVESIT